MPISPVYGRTRVRVTPQLGKSNVILGKKYPAIMLNGLPTGKFETTASNTFVFDYKTGARWDKAQVTQDSVHQGPPYRSGGDFSSLKYTWCTPYIGVAGFGTYDRQDKLERYVGGFHPPMAAGDFCPSGVLDAFAFANNSDLWLLRTSNNTNHPTMDGLGDKAWKSTKPKLEKAGAGVFGAELRDMPRMLWRDSRRFHDIWRGMGGHYTSGRAAIKRGLGIMRPKKVADDFLSQQFGWAPFIRDLGKFHTVVTEYHDIIAKLTDRNDRWVRRRVPLNGYTIQTPIRSANMNVCFPALLHSSFFVAPPSYSCVEIEKTTITGVGKFRFYRPEFAKVDDEISQWQSAQQFLTVSGLRVNPSNIYKAIPWTWLIDWFGNVGDYIDHLNDVWLDSVACQYCFVMRHQIKTRELIQVLPFHSGERTLSFSRVIESKQRRQGRSPFAFDSTWDGLSPTQLAIAAALGFSRS